MARRCYYIYRKTLWAFTPEARGALRRILTQCGVKDLDLAVALLEIWWGEERLYDKRKLLDHRSGRAVVIDPA